MSALPPEQTLHTDARIAAQILGNLIDNARKYSAERRGPPRLAPGPPRRWSTAFIWKSRIAAPACRLGERAGIFKPFRRGS